MPNTILKTLIKLLTEYTHAQNLTPGDFVENALRERRLEENEGQHFLHMIKHNLLLEKVADGFIEQYTLRRVKKPNVKVLFYFVIFLLNECNYDNLPDLYYLKHLLEYLTEESTHLFITKIACKIFENAYILESLMYPLLNKVDLIKQVIEKIEEQQKMPRTPFTVPEEFECFKMSQKNAPPPPVNTPEEHEKFKAKPFIKRSPLKIQKKLEQELLKNQEKAFKLLEEAERVPQRLLECNRVPKEGKEFANKTFKAKKPPRSKDVEIKGNLTSTLREGSRLIKEQESEIKRIEEIVKGGCTAERIEQLEMERRQEESRKEMEAIEKKHLQGLLTYEEAILARKKLLESNKQKMIEYQEARVELVAKLDKWREEEQNKIKALVEKCQRIKQNAKESEKKLHEEKQSQVKLQQHETRKMLRMAYEKQQRELSRKVELIQEIRALQQIGCKMHVKEFDPTECPNFGLLCEMSIAELQERLALAKIRMTEELEEKRQCILKGKEEQQKMVENVKNFISQTRRMSKPRPVPIPAGNLERSPELDELKRQLEEKRNLRMKPTYS